MFKNTKFTTKLFFSMIVITLATLIVVSWSSIYMAKKGLFTLGEKGIIATHKGVYSSLEESIKSLEPKLREDIELLSTKFNAEFNLVIDKNSTQKKDGLNHLTGVTTTIDVPEIYLNQTPLSQNNILIPFIDQIAAITGAEITVFQLVDNKLLSIASTIKIEGKRAIGTYIPPSSPIFQAIVKGDSFTGKAFIIKEDFLTNYIPLKDSSGEIVGALFAGKPVISGQIREIIKETKIGSGYFFAYTAEGLTIEHPTAIGRNFLEDFPPAKGVDKDFIRYTSSTGEKKAIYTSYLPAADIFLAVGMPESEIVGGLDMKMLRNSVFIGIGLLIVAVLFTLFIVRTINRPLQQLADKTVEVAQGDYTVEFHSDVKDNIGLLTRSLGQMTEKGNKMIQDIRNSAQALATASTELATVSGDMVKNAEESAYVSEEAAQNSAKVSDNMHSVSSAMEQSTVNLDTIASASEEMGNTIKEIASNSERARATTGEAVESAKRSYADVQKLGDSAKSIGSITETITDISEQTNLLALNATIEAARAGEAGKGFAVVANEIKELAKGTAEATGKIRTAIEGIQSQTSNTVEEISKIATVIEDVNEIVTTIVTAVEEQSITTNEIVGNVAQASQGIGEINENVANSNQMTAEVTAGVEEVKEKSAAVKANSEQVSTAASELSQLSEKLTEMVGQFKI